MKLVVLLLAIATVSYGATSGLKAHLNLKNQVLQNEEALIKPTFSVLPADLEIPQEDAKPEEVDPEEYYTQSETKEDVPVEAYTSYAPVQAANEESIVILGDAWTSEGANEEPVVILGDAWTSEGTNEESIVILGDAWTSEEIPDQKPVIGVVGGWRDIDTSSVENDAALQGLVQLAIDVSLDEGRKDGKIPKDVEYTLLSVDRIQAQTVAGINYQIETLLTDGDKRRIYTNTTIFDQSWTKTRNVISTCIKVGKMVKI